VAPHNLVSISVFEDDHPCPKNFYHVVVMHKGDDSIPIKRSEEIKGDIYSLSTNAFSNSWERAIKRSCDAIDEQGYPDNKFRVSTYNIS
jgi:hypothetical protein